MKIVTIFDHFGRKYDSGKFAGEGPWEVTGDDIIELSKDHDVGIIHCYGPAPTRKQRAAGMVQEESLAIHLDSKGGHFHQR